MMKKSLLCVALSAMMTISVQAQNREGTVSLDSQFVIYKWYEKGIAHYGKVPPRGVSNYIMLNQYGMEISKERPYANETGSNIIRPIRPETSASENMGSGSHAESALPEGSISREQRCDIARSNVKMLRNKTTVYEDDGNGNLIPLSKEVIAQRLQQAEQQVTEYCQ